MINDLAGRLYATIEDILIEYGLCPDPQYRQYAYRLNAGTDSNLLSLETTLLALTVICKPAEKSFVDSIISVFKEQQKLMPIPLTDYILKLRFYNEKLKEINNIAYQYINHTLDLLQDQKAEAMPQKLKERFI